MEKREKGEKGSERGGEVKRGEERGSREEREVK